MVVEQKQKLFWNQGTKWNILKPCRSLRNKIFSTRITLMSHCSPPVRFWLTKGPVRQSAAYLRTGGWKQQQRQDMAGSYLAAEMWENESTICEGESDASPFRFQSASADVFHTCKDVTRPRRYWTGGQVFRIIQAWWENPEQQIQDSKHLSKLDMASK